MFVLRPFQERAVRQTRAHLASGAKSCVIVSPTGCHPRGQRILAYDGTLVAIEDVRVGDLLMGPDSGPRRVLDLRRGAGPIYRVVPNKGLPFRVNRNHILTLVRTNDGTSRAGTIVDVPLDEWMKWSKTATHIHKLFRVAVEFPSARPLEIDPYFVGLLLGDGVLTNGRVAVCKPDPEILAETQRVAAHWGARVRLEHYEGRCPVLHVVTDRGAENRLLTAIRRIGLAEIGARQKSIPDAYKTASRRDRLSLLAGLLDTDGYLSGSGYDFISASKTLSNDLAFVARSVGLAAYVTQTVKSCQNGFSGTYWRVSISGDCSCIPCRIPRRQAPARRHVKNTLVTGFHVAEDGAEEFYGFLLDGDGRYLLDDFTVTHNSGKTVLASHIIAAATAKGSRTLFVAHRDELIAQCCAKLKENGVQHGVIKAGYTPNPFASVQVCSWQTFTRRIDSLEQGYRLIVIDECHHSTAAGYRTILASNPQAVVLGLTATPYRADGQGLAEIFQTMVLVATVEQLVNDGYLVPPRTIVCKAKPNLRGLHTRGGDWKTDELAGRLNTPDRNHAVVKDYTLNAYGRPAVVFAVDVAHSIALADAFRSGGYNFVHIDGDTPTERRRQALEDLAMGRVQGVTNCGVLTEGWDCPIVSCCVFARSTKSRGLWRQMGGRVLRTHPGKFNAIVLDHAGCTDAHGWLTDPDNLSLDKGVLPPDRAAAKYKCKRCGAMSYSRPRICPNCGADTRQPVQLDLLEHTYSDGWEFVEADPDTYRRQKNVQPCGESVLAALAEQYLADLEQAYQSGGNPGKAAYLYYRRTRRWPSKELQEQSPYRIVWKRHPKTGKRIAQFA